MDIGFLHNLFLNSGGVTTDSRSIKGGEIFFALKGENFDGNKYAMQALESGAAYAVVEAGSDASRSGDARVIVVDNVLNALQALARYHREHTFVDGKRLTVIGLTGTNGKTTTKELLRAVLSCKYKVTATEGNLNNDIGVPLSLLKINAETELAVIEMGANHPDDIAHLVSVCEPDYGLITNVGRGHLLGFGSYEGVKKAKGQLYDYISARGKAVFINADDPVLMEMASARSGMRTIEYGVAKDDCEILPATLESPYLRMAYDVRGANGNGCAYPICTRLVGAYNAVNVIAAITVGLSFGVSLEEAVAAIENYLPSNKRSQLQKTDRNILVLDAYNANPVSMSAALDSLASMSGTRKAVMAGDMKELGNDSLSEHSAMIEKISAMSFDKIFLVGPEFGAALKHTGKDIMWFENALALRDYLASDPISGYAILVKGSRSMTMEKVIDVL